jgi:hypothetical protein
MRWSECIAGSIGVSPMVAVLRENKLEEYLDIGETPMLRHSRADTARICFLV